MTKRIIGASLFCLVAVVAGTEEIRFIPAASSSPGRFGTMWSTDLWIYNLQDDGPITVWASFMGPAEGTSAGTEVAIDLPTGAMVTVRDAVRELFGLTASGAIRLRSEFKFEARSRTFNRAEGGGELGQGIPAVALPDAGGTRSLLDNSGALLGAGNLPGAEGIRTNLGLLNTSDQTLECEVWVFQDEPAGALVGRAQNLEIGPGEWFQADVFELVGAADRDIPSARVLFWDLGFDHGLIGYLSRVDNQSGDATYIDRMVPRRYRVTPAMYQTDLELQLDGALDVGSITYTGPDGEDVVVIRPPHGWRVAAQASSNHDFCYRFVANVSAGGVGSATLHYRLRADQGALEGYDTCAGAAHQKCILKQCLYLP